MTKTHNYTSTEDYRKSPDYYREKGRLQGYNEVMKFLNEFCPLGNPETYKVAKMIEMEFRIDRNCPLTPVADELGIFQSEN